MKKKKLTEKELKLAKLSKQLKEFMADTVDGMPIHDGVVVIGSATARMLHEFAMTMTEDDVEEYLGHLEVLKNLYKKMFDSVIKTVFEQHAKEHLKK